MYLRLLCLFSLITVPFFARSQDRCSTVEYEHIRHQKNPSLESIKQFEQWLRAKALQPLANSTQRTEGTPYIIPVVVHVVHNGEPVGTGVNVSDAQVVSQINVLNNDYQRLNADAVNTPTEFQPVAGNLNIQFVLAKQDPNGLPTNGIVRVKGTKSSWNLNDDALLKSMSYWPAENYMNIWVTNLTSPLVGYAQFPVSTLPGLENSPNDRLTDGLMIDYTAFGSINDGPFVLDSRFNRGRTATHEIGHFFGLRHIWGDITGCTGSDYVDDTPTQTDSYNGQCPSGQKFSCSTSNMYQNFLDYTNDPCMNLFTKGQVDRMTYVITNSPRRASLLTSPGANPPGGNNNIVDIGIVSYSSPTPVSCKADPTPSLSIKNKGTVDLYSFKIIGTLNGIPLADQIVTTTPITPGQEKTFDLTKLTLQAGTNQAHYEIIEPNGVVDASITDNFIDIRAVQNTTSDVIPLRERFDSNFDNNWITVSQGQDLEWANTRTNKGQSQIFMAYSNTNIGASSWLVSPTLNLSHSKKASLFFDVSYAKRDIGNDGLQVLLSEDCGATYTKTLYDRSGGALATAYSNADWQPTSTADWRRDYINLDDYVGNNNLRFAFIATGDHGNNIYLDNIEFFMDDNPNPVSIENKYSIYGGQGDFKITFNLDERQPVRLAVYNSIGQLITDNLLDDTLNQTYTVDLNRPSAGIYIVKLQIGTDLSATKIFLTN